MDIKKHSRWAKGLALAAALMLPLSGCDLDQALAVNDPDTVNPGTLDDPRALGQLVNGAIRDFQDGYSGAGGDAFLSTTALMSDEFFSVGTFTTRTATDRRLQFPIAQGNTSDGAFNSLQFARRGLKDALAKLEETGNTADPDYGLLLALRGYTYVAMAEAYCGYIPFSEIEDGSTVYGTPVSAVQALEESLPIFDAAIAAGSTLGRIGKARALVNLGRYSEAAAAVSGVPTTYVYYMEHSSSSAVGDNPMFALMANGRYSMSNLEGTNGMPFRAPNGGSSTDPANADPRLNWINDGPGFDPALGDVYMAKYFTLDDDVILADGVEARLIEAEAALASGGDWLGILNDLRAQASTLIPLRTAVYPADMTMAPLTDPGSADARLDLIMQERAFWMWGTGHRLGDLRRMVRNYGRSAESVYPSGAYHKGGTYGPDVVFLLDFDEANNPEFDPNSCSATSVN